MIASGYRILTICTVLLASLAATVSSPVVAVQSGREPGAFERELEIDGRVRTYSVHVPAGAGSSMVLPLLVVLHGGGGNGEHIERSTGFSRLADEQGFIVVYPDGTGRLDRRLTWNAANCCGYAHQENMDDVGFIDAMLDAIAAEFAPDMSRVYLTGHSNGGMMTYRLGCELAGRFAAIAPVAGALNDENCAPAWPLPILIVHGEDDQNVPFDGGSSTGVGASGEDSRIDRPVSFAIDTWTTINGCAPAGQTTITDVAAITTWSDCSSGALVQLVDLLGWGHPWPSPAAIPQADVDASRLVWEFVSQFSLGG